MKSITEAGDLGGKKVFVRVDWNVPIQNGKVANDFRIRKSLPTIEFLKKAGAKIILATHFEGNGIRALRDFVPEGVKLLPNLRDDEGEKANSAAFAKKLARKVDVYVNEAFSVSHREHASVVGVPKLLPSFAGLWFMKEVKNLSQAFYPKHPFLLILGGAKFETKLPLLKKFVEIADNIFIGGAMANNFFKELGRDVGNSLVSDGNFGLKDLMKSDKIILPEDTIVHENKILDVGPKSLESLSEKISEAKLILWSGPLGAYERGFKVSTLELAKMIAESENDSIVGGGDTLAAIEELQMNEKFSFVSTGGGAMLDFLAKGTLPGIEALNSPHL